jgi:hypothetical protein
LTAALAQAVPEALRALLFTPEQNEGFEKVGVPVA